MPGPTTRQGELFPAPNESAMRASPLLEWARKAPTRKALWSALREAGLVEVGVNTFYKALKRDGFDAYLLALEERAPRENVDALVRAGWPVPPPRVAVSTLAQQFYCEMQVHLGTLHDVRVVTAEMAEGAARHAALEAEAEPNSDEEIEARLDAGEALGLVEMPLALEAHGVRLVGRADHALVERERARLVLEYKFSSRTELFASHVMQVLAYGAMLDGMGYRADALVLSVAMLPRGTEPEPALANRLGVASLAPFTLPPPREDKPVVTEPYGAPSLGVNALTLHTTHMPEGVVHAFAHDRALAGRALEWTTAYWTGAREPVANSSPGKCRACPYNAASLCGFAMAPPGGRFEHRVIEREGRPLHLLVSGGFVR